MKRVKVALTAAVLLLAVGGAFASKARAYAAYTSYWDMYPGQVYECQVRGFCPGTGSLCTTRPPGQGFFFQLYYSGCTYPLTGIYNEQ
jgi:hypothetical protein